MTRDDTAEAIDRLAPPPPPCFDSRQQWHSWLCASAETGPSPTTSPIQIRNGVAHFNARIGYCQDCPVSYRSEMLKRDRCCPTWVRRQMEKLVAEAA